jgi:hypothetical protein
MNKQLPLAIAIMLLCITTLAAEKKTRLPPAPGTVFRLSPSYPGYVTCEVEFRDPSESFWPNFFFGKPAGEGTFTFDPAAPKAAFSLRCDTMAQRNGDQSRRLLGELVKESKPPVVSFTVTALGKPATESVEVAGKGGKPGKKTVEYTPAEGVLDVGGKKVSVSGKAAFHYAWGKTGETPESVTIDIRFRLQGSNLGLKNYTGLIEARAGTTAYARPDAGKKK